MQPICASTYGNNEYWKNIAFLNSQIVYGIRSCLLAMMPVLTYICRIDEWFVRRSKLRNPIEIDGDGSHVRLSSRVDRTVRTAYVLCWSHVTPEAASPNTRYGTHPRSLAARHFHAKSRPLLLQEMPDLLILFLTAHFRDVAAWMDLRPWSCKKVHTVTHSGCKCPNWFLFGESFTRSAEWSQWWPWWPWCSPPCTTQNYKYTGGDVCQPNSVANYFAIMTFRQPTLYWKLLSWHNGFTQWHTPKHVRMAGDNAAVGHRAWPSRCESCSKHRWQSTHLSIFVYGWCNLPYCLPWGFLQYMVFWQFWIGS